MMAQDNFEEFLEDIQDILKKKIVEWWNIIDKLGNAQQTLQWSNTFKDHILDVCDEMIASFTGRQNEVLSKIEMLLKRSNDLCKELNLKMPVYGAVELSLYEEEELLVKRIKEYEQILEAKNIEINTLNEQHIRLCHCLGREAHPIIAPPFPSPELVLDFRRNLQSLETEKLEREHEFLEIKSAVQDIVDQLKYKPTLDFEKKVISGDISLFLVTNSNMKKLRNFYESIQQQYTNIEDEITVLREKVKHLWEIISEDQQTCNLFLNTYTEVNIDTLEALKQEVKRCEVLKKANIEVFVKSLRDEIITLWDQCHFGEEEREFEYLHTSLYTEDLLSLHEIEIQKLRAYHASNSDLFNLLEKRDELWTKMLELEQRATAPDRYKNRGGQLLKEEKDRNTLLSRIPKIEEQLLELARQHENEAGKPFLSWGKTVESIIFESHQHRNENKKTKLSARKNQDKITTPGRSKMGPTPTKSRMGLTPIMSTMGPSPTKSRMGPSPTKSRMGLTPCASTQKLRQLSPTEHSSKRKVAAALFPAKRTKVLVNHNINVQQTEPPKLLVNGKLVGRSRYSMERAKRIEKCRLISQRKQRKDMEKENSGSSEYIAFKEDLTSKQACRSTLFCYSDDNLPLAVPLPTTSLRPANTPRRTPAINTKRFHTPRQI